MSGEYVVVPDDLSEDQQVEFVRSEIVKRGGYPGCGRVDLRYAMARRVEQFVRPDRGAWLPRQVTGLALGASERISLVG